MQLAKNFSSACRNCGFVGYMDNVCKHPALPSEKPLQEHSCHFPSVTPAWCPLGRNNIFYVIHNGGIEYTGLEKDCIDYILGNKAPIESWPDKSGCWSLHPHTPIP